jgi:hypothetical protein
VADTLTAVARLAGWLSPTKQDAAHATLSPAQANRNGSLVNQAYLSGWTTPNARDWKSETGSENNSYDKSPNLSRQVLAGWETPTSRDHFPAHSQEYVDDKKAQGHGMANLNDQAALLVGWPTPMAGSPATDTYNAAGNNDFSRKVAEVTPSGPTSTSSPASTANRGALNPDFSRWLMGYPAAWLFAAPVKKNTGTRGRERSGASGTPSCPK